MRLSCLPLAAPCIALIACLALAATLSPVARAQSADAKAKQAAAQQKLDAVKDQIKALAAQQRQTGDQRDNINARLAQQAQQLAAAATALQASDAAIATTEAKLQELQKQHDALDTRLKGQRAALADLLRAAYAVGRGSDLRVLLGDADVARIARALAYSQYFQRDRSKRIRALLRDLSRLEEVQASITTEQKSLQVAHAMRQQQMQSLAAERQAQRTLLAEAEARLKDQAARLKALHDNQQALTHLLEKLRDVFADIPVKLPADADFAHLRGALPWPLHGDVRPSGSGVRITATSGATVRAVAHGRVAYADWLRGYGMLIIVDHGKGWMSLYGDNETLARGVGEWVDAGDAVGTAGATQGANAGVYFELRHDGKSVDPRPWLAKGKP